MIQLTLVQITMSRTSHYSKKQRSLLAGWFFPLLLILINCVNVSAQVCITDLVTEYQTAPIGLDEAHPRFSWKMAAADHARGIYQTAYQISVEDENGEEVWNSGRVERSTSLNIGYAGKSLEPRTTYSWKVEVWDQDGTVHEQESTFETGLMDASTKAWNGAEWIGGGEDDLVFYSHAISVFKGGFRIQLEEESSSTKAAFVLGANDVRLMTPHLNILGVNNDMDESYYSLELDISGLETESGIAHFNIYRVGYTPEDSNEEPMYSLEIPTEIIHNENKYDEQQIWFDVIFGQLNVYINGMDEAHRLNADPAGLPINPHGTLVADQIAYPMIADIGFATSAGQKARFSDVHFKNYRAPSNVIFDEHLSGISASIFDGLDGVQINDGSYLIGGEGDVLAIADPGRNSVPMLRTEFNVQKAIQKARLYVTARGIYEMYVNGERVGEDYFNPGLTQYNKTHMYQTYDVTELVNEGQNAIGARLSEGWWSGNTTFRGNHWNYFGDRQSLLTQLIITYEDGSEEIITSNPDEWKFYNDGPVLSGSFFQGEIYDATKEASIDGWSEPGFDDSDWKPAQMVALDGTTYSGSVQETDFPGWDTKLIGQMGNNAGIVKELTPVSVTEIRPGVFIYDMGQNMVGFPRIKISGKAGQTVTLRYAEMLYPDLPEHEGLAGTMMMENIRAALTLDQWTLKGGEEIIQPRFTFHGFRYLEISGIEEAVLIEDVQGLVVSSVDELTSSYETSNELVNRLWQNISWSMRSNFLSIPTDTPARNERMGWNGDINVFSRTSMYLGDVHQFLRRHMLANRDLQQPSGRFEDIAPIGKGFGGTLWGSAGITIPWELYLHYGDKRVLEENYEAMKAYVDYLETRRREDGILDEGPLGDWLSPVGYKNDNSLFWEAYQVRNLDIVAKSALLLENVSDFKKYIDLMIQQNKFFNATYVDANTGKTIQSGYPINHWGPSPIPRDSLQKGDWMDTQASYAIPLAFGVFDDENEPKAVEHLVSAIERSNLDELGVCRPELSLMTGFIGTASLGEALSEHGESELMYRILQQTSYPSWLYPVTNGATTIWERLNSYTIENGFGGNNNMNSFNHYSFGAVGAWMMNYSLGILRNEAGFHGFRLQPTPDESGEMTWASGHYESPYGRIESTWKVEGGKLIYTATVPPNTSAGLYLPTSDVESVMESSQPAEDSEGIQFLKYENGRAVYLLSSGTYSFEADWE